MAPLHTSVASPDIAFDANGRLLVTWTQSPARPGRPYTGPFTIRVREWTAGHGWGTVRVLGRSGHFLLAQPRLAVNVRGDAIVSWRGLRRSGRHVVEALASSLRLVGGRFGPTRLAAGGGPYRDVALDLRGNAYGVYTNYRGPQNFYVYQPRGHGWQSPRPMPGVPASKPRIGVEPDRLVVIVWRAADVDSEGNGIQAGPPWAVVGHLGSFALPFRLSTMPVTDVAITEPGAFVTWAAPDFIEQPEPGAPDLHYALRGEGFAVGGDTTVPGARMGPSVLVFPGRPIVVYGADGAIRSVTFDRRTATFGPPETIAAHGASPSLAASHDCVVPSPHGRTWTRTGWSSPSGRRDLTPATHPGARPRSGSRAREASMPLPASSHETTEFEFHISPVASSSRPQTLAGTSGTRSSRHRAARGSSLSRCGLSTASAASGIRPSGQQRTS